MAKEKKVKNKQAAVSLGPVTVPIRTKESLKKDNKKLSSELLELHRRYRQVSNVILQLTQDYEDSKSSAPPARYKLLKDMIKRSTTDDVIQSTCPPEFAEVKAAAKQNRHADSAGGSPGLHRSISDDLEKRNAHSNQHTRIAASKSMPSSMGGLLSTCRTFAGMADDTAGSKENMISSAEQKLSKKEVEHDNEQKVREITNYDNKFLRARNRLVKLRKEYEASKEHLFPKRYSLMKDMIKTVISDKKLTS